MYFELQGNTLTALITNKRKTEPYRRNISSLLILHSKDLNELLNATKRRAIGKAYSTNALLVQEVLLPFGQYLHWDTRLHHEGKCYLPSNFSGWQHVTLQFGLWYISRPNSQASLTTLCSVWKKTVRPWLNYLQEEGIIPLGVVLPNMCLPKEHGANGSLYDPRLIGDQPARPIIDDQPVAKAPLDKTLAGPIFWRTDAEYLDQVETLLRHRDKVLSQVLDDYWLRLVLDYRNGRKMLKEVTTDDWQLREDCGLWRDKITRSGTDAIGRKYNMKLSVALASPKHPCGHAWALRLMEQQLCQSNSPDCLHSRQLQQHPVSMGGFSTRVEETPVLPLLNASSLSPQQAEQLKPSKLYHRFLGLLNDTDMAVAIALLIREHANWTPESLASAQLLNAHGKSYLMLADEGQRQIFSVEKPRACSRKYGALTPRATRILRHIQRATATVRALLKRAGSPHWRQLLLGITRTKKNITSLGHPTRIYAHRLYNVDKSDRLSLARLYPELTNAGLGPGTLSFTKIRHTQGVLAWFDKGSIRAASRRLGNSMRVAIEHYIPESLLQAWNERIIRRFQNTLLVLAASDQDYLLEVVDMPNLAELHRFLAQLVYELPKGSSPIADKVQRFFGDSVQSAPPNHREKPQAKPNSLLHLRLSPNSLALLLAYRQWAQLYLPPTSQTRPDNLTGLTPKHFIDLGSMLQATVKSDSISHALRESLEVTKLQRVYSLAESKVPELVTQLTHLSLQPTDMRNIT